MFPDMNDINDMIKDITDMLNNSNKSKNDNKKPNVSAKAWINGKEVDLSKIDINTLLNSAFGGAGNIFNQPQPNQTANDIKQKRAMLTKTIEKSVNIITNILKMCGNKKPEEVFMSETYDPDINTKILKENNFTNSTFNMYMEDYHLDLSKIKNIKKFLNAFVYAIKKGQIA